MKILYISTWFPYPADNGARIRVFSQIKTLAKNNQIFLISMLQDDFKQEESKELAKYCKIVYLQEKSWFKAGTLKAILGYFNSKPRSVYSSYDKSFQEAVDLAVEDIKPDITIASTLGSVEYVKINKTAKIIFDHHNCDYASLQRSAALIKNPFKKVIAALGVWKTAKYELAQCKKFDIVSVVSESDKKSLMKLNSSISNIRVIPNAIDVDYYDPSLHKPKQNQLIYNGSPTFFANYDAINYFEKQILSLIPNVELVVTGRTESVDLSLFTKTNFIGYQQDIRPILYESAVCVIPLRQGGGTRLKILEAMAAGVPVVSTSVGAEGLNAVNGEHLIIADSEADFADAITKIIQDPELAHRLKNNARKFVCKHYSWEVSGNKLNEAIGEAFSK